jgi:Flp pilus assembly pilin Flp
MNTWKGAFVAVLMSGVVLGIFTGHLAVWTAVGAALGAVLAGRERNRVLG